MRYQLVVQFAAASLGDFDDLMTFEEALMKEMRGSSLVDGHDFGSGEMNIFVFTDHPDSALRQVQDVAGKIHPKREMKVAYRELEQAEFHILWPPDLNQFSVM